MATVDITGNAALSRVARINSIVWKKVYDTLYADLVDPRSRGTKWIYGAYPDKAIEDSSYYPLVVISPVTVSTSQVYDLDRINRDQQVDLEIQVYATETAQMDSISDAVYEIMLLNDDDFTTANLYNMSINSSTESFIMENGKRIHLKTQRVSFLCGASV